MQKLSLAEANLTNIQNFLNLYKKDTTRLSNISESNPKVFIGLAQLPDLWLKTRTPFNRNKIFAVPYSRRRDPLSRQQAKYLALELSSKDNYFPRSPLIIPNEAELRGDSIKLKDLSMEHLFEEQKESDNEGLLEHLFMIAIQYRGDLKKYGPITSHKTYIFLKSIYSNLTAEEKADKMVLVVDLDMDVHFQPDALREILDEAIKKKKKKFDMEFPKLNLPCRHLPLNSKFNLPWRKRSFDSNSTDHYSSLGSDAVTSKDRQKEATTKALVLNN